jgi:hypothetical protein
MAYETPNYIKALLKPNGSKPAGRRVWSIDLESVWLPAFTAMNAMGETRIPHEALGAPLRLAYNTDGTVKFSKTGRPVVKVVKDIADSVKLIRENLIAGLVAHAHSVATEFPDEYKTEAMANQEAGRPIVDKDRHALTEAVIAAADAEIAKAKAQTAADKVLAAA